MADSALQFFAIEPDDAYSSQVAVLTDMFICNPVHVRPQTKTPLAPFDQASQRPVFGPSSDRGSPEEFIAWARTRVHPDLGPPPALPADLEGAITHIWTVGPGCARDRELRLETVRGVARALEPLSCVLCMQMSAGADQVARAMMLNVIRRSNPEAKLSDVGDRRYCVHLALLCAILDSIQWPYRRLAADMAHGFRTVGNVPDTGVWRPVETPASMPMQDFAASNHEWVYACQRRVLAAARGNPEMAQACWERTLQELGDGLIDGPFTLSQLNERTASGYPAFGYGKFRPLPRFAIWQGKKYRCIDDGAASGTNTDGMSLHETIVCDRPDMPLRIGQRFCALGPPPRAPQTPVQMGGGTDDKFAAYRCVVTCDGEYTVVMVAAPARALHPDAPQLVYLFRVPGHNFGLASAVLNFNSVPEPMVAFSRRALAVPVCRYYDDHAVCEPSYSLALADGISAQDAHFELHEILRFHFDLGKHVPWGPSVLFVGVLTDWSRVSEKAAFVGVTSERRRKVKALIEGHVHANKLTPREASTLRGKSRFCVCPVFGRAGLAVVHLLRERQHHSDTSELDDALRDALTALGIIVARARDFRVPLIRDVRPPVVILTDASFEQRHTWLGFLVLHPWNGARWAGAPTPQWLLRLFERHRARQTYIGQLEGIELLAPYWSLPRSWFEGRAVLHYVDNQGALYAAIHGRSNDVDLNRIVFLLRARLDGMQCRAWFDYVPSASNAADLPTRLDAEAFTRLERIADRVPHKLPPEWCLDCTWSELSSVLDD